MSDDWLQQLQQLHEADKAERQTKTAQDDTQPLPTPASDLLRQSNAHTLLRQVQKALLGGGGILDIFDRAGQYERVITRAWQGPISAARKPNPNDPTPYRYILVGVREGKLYVNGKKLKETSPEALKAALLWAGKNPGQEQRHKK
jgi:hypothetical protein